MKILLFANLRSALGRNELDVHCDGVDTATLWGHLLEVAPQLAKYRSAVRLARNSEFTEPDTRFYDGDEVALIPPVSGG